MKRSRSLFAVLATAAAILWLTTAAWAYEIGHTILILTDQTRGKNIPTEVYYPADSAGENVPVASGQFPLLVFGHGQRTAIPYQHHYWEALVPEGYVMALPTTEMGGSVYIDEFGKDLSFVLGAFLDRNAMKDTLFAWHLNGTSALMGYSMGGGASFLAQAGNSKANAIVAMGPVGTLVTYGSTLYGTNPIDVAGEISVPVLIVAGELDCVTPVATHQEPLYERISSPVKSLIDITEGNHCGFHDTTMNYNCASFEAGFCSGQTDIPMSNEMQMQITLDYVRMWLDAILKGNAVSWADFGKTLYEGAEVTSRFSGESDWPPVYLTAPHLTQQVDGITAALFWNPVPGAESYTLYYALYPYNGSIGSVNMGNMTSLHGDLWPGAAFYFAVKAVNDAAISNFSNVELMMIP